MSLETLKQLAGAINYYSFLPQKSLRPKGGAFQAIPSQADPASVSGDFFFYKSKEKKTHKYVGFCLLLHTLTKVGFFVFTLFVLSLLLPFFV